MILSRYERMIARRYLLPAKGEGFIFLVAGISLVAVMLGVAALIIVMSVMNGFRAELFDKVTGLNGHAVIQVLLVLRSVVVPVAVDRRGQSEGPHDEQVVVVVALQAQLRGVHTPPLRQHIAELVYRRELDGLDHGGHDEDHGSDDPRDVTIPWIAWGRGVQTGELKGAAIRTMDTASTALWLLGVDEPADWMGTPVMGAFAPPPPAPGPGDR